MSVATRIPTLPLEEHERRMRRANSSLEDIWALLDKVKDPEIPVVSIWELGVLQNVEQRHGTVIVTITPTYSGCPAMDVIREDVAAALADGGHADAEIVTRLTPAWSSNWILPRAQDALREYGIAPPGTACGAIPAQVCCPLCGSDNVRSISEFGSTACKALYQCSDCAEPFDHFKPI